MAGVVVLDTCVLIAFFKRDDPFHGQAVTIVTSAVQREHALHASELTLAEFLVGPVRAGELEHAEQLLADVGVHACPLPTPFAARLARIRHEAAVKLPDAAVLMAALDLAATDAAPVAVATFDHRLRAGALKHGLCVENGQ